MSNFTPTEPLPEVETDDASKYSLPADYKFPGRPVASGSSALAGTPGYDPADFRPGRPGGGGPTVYAGSKLVDRNGVIVRDQYSVLEAYGELARMGRGERLEFTNELFARGAYDKGKPTDTRLGQSDQTAMRNYLLTMNRLGKTIDAGRGEFRAEFASGSPYGGGGRARQVTNADDLKMVFKKSAADLLGHSLSKEEEERFARLYQQMERGGDTPTASVSASNQIQKRFGAEAQSYQAGGLAEIMDEMIAGWGQ